MRQAKIYESITVTDGKDLGKLNIIMHDEGFNIDEISYDSSTKILTIPFDRWFHGIDQKVVRNYFIFRIIEAPLLKSSLRVMNVEEYSIVDKHKIVNNSFNVIKYHEMDHLLSIDTNIPTEFQIRVSSLNLEYSGHEFQGKARIYAGLLPFPWETGPRVIKDK